MAKPIILCVDDETVILDSLKIQLKETFADTFTYETAESAGEAMEIIAELTAANFEIIVIVSDWLMPGLKGDELLVQIHQKFPKVIKVMLTGQADSVAIERATKEGGLHCCLFKPWTKAELIETIKSGLTKL